jgi:TonB family protein
MKLRLTSALLFLVYFSVAQEKVVNVYFLKNNGRYVTDRDSADYLRIVSAPDSGSTFYNVAEYYKNKKRKLIGKSSTIDPPVLEGPCARYYNSGIRESRVSYRKGLAIGEEYDFYPNGKLYQVIVYPDNSDPYNNLTYNFLIKANYDSLGVALVEDGKGYFKGYDDKFSYINEEGPVQNGKRNGLWKGNFKNINTSFSEEYNDGQLISGTATFDDGSNAAYSKTRRTFPEFKGGIPAFSEYLGSNIIYPRDARRLNTQGRVIVQFVVDKDGTISNIEVKRHVSPSIDAEAVRVIKNSPRWVPGRQFGRNVKVSYSVPIQFTLTN